MDQSGEALTGGQNKPGTTENGMAGQKPRPLVESGADGKHDGSGGDGSGGDGSVDNGSVDNGSKQDIHAIGYSSALPIKVVPGDRISPAAQPAPLSVLSLISADQNAITDLRDKLAIDKVSSPAINFHSKGDNKVEISGRQLLADGKFVTDDGVKAMKKGDWIVVQPNGQSRMESLKEFQEAFAPDKLEVKAPLQKYIKALSIEAELITKPTEWINPDAAPGSPPKIANPGDYWAKPKGQAPYVIPGAYFKENYVQIPGTGEYARTTITNAQILDKPVSVWSSNSGVTSGGAGDYLITRPDGNQAVLSKQKFEEQFALAEVPSEQREPLSKPKATGERFVLDGKKGVTAEPWEHGLILYDGQSVTVTDNRDSSTKKYVEGRLAAETTTVKEAKGDWVISRSYPYGDLETVRALPTLDSYKDLLERRPELKRAQEIADSMPMTHYINTPQRIELREQIRAEIWTQMDQLRHAPADDGSGSMQLAQGRNLHIVLGLSGSGKSTIANKIASENHAFIPDVDEVKPKLPEWQRGTGAAATTVEAHQVMNPIIQDSLARGDNLVIPLVGASSERIDKLIQEANAKGYEIHLSLVDVPSTEAMKRIVGRLEKGGLYVDPTYLASLGNRPLQNFKMLVNKYIGTGVIASYHQINNLGRAPVLVDEGHVSGRPNTSGLPDDFFANANVKVERQTGSDDKIGTTVPVSKSAVAGEQKATESEEVFDPGSQFKSSKEPLAGPAKRQVETHEGAAPNDFLSLMAISLDQRSPEQKADLEKYMKELDLNPAQSKTIADKTSEAVSRGIPYVIALGAALGLARSYLESGLPKNQPVNTYNQ
jgi:predicted ABC-type ATPase